MSNQPLSEQYRLLALDWTKKDAAARMLEEAKTATLAQRMNVLGDIPVSHAERIVKGSPEWSEYIEEMVQARTAANEAKIEMRYVEMRAFEQHSSEATARVEARL